jgi:CRISPR-associated endonuclease/helicase Cas3
MMNDRLDKSLWAKSGQLDAPYPLVFHLLDTCAAAMVLWERYLTASQRRVIATGLGVVPEHARQLVAFWAGVHDVGKLSPGFQRCDEAGWHGVSDRLRLSEGLWRPLRHDMAGLRCASGLLDGLGYEMDDGAADSPGWRVAQIIGGHHGRFHTTDYDVECVGPFALEDLGQEEWRAQRELHVRAVFEAAGSPSAPSAVPVAVAVLVTGIVILADWLVSQEHFLKAAMRGDPAETVTEHFDASSAAVIDLVADAGLDAMGLEWKPADFKELFGIDSPNPLQSSIDRELPGAVKGPGILVVTTSMGDGKTELALVAHRIMAAASGTDGLFFGLPTMATSDQMYGRLREYAGRATTGPAAVTLAHSMAWLNQAYEDQALRSDGPVVTGEAKGTEGSRTAAPQWLRGSKRPLLARLGSGTIDQALSAVLPVRHNALRILALSGRTLIVDEAHACDPYMQALLQRLLTWLAGYGCPVILLSATLPGTTVDRLVRAYLRGAGWKNKSLPFQPYRPSYPGWIYADATDAHMVTVSDLAAEQQTLERHTELRVDLCPVRHHTFEPGNDLPERSRLAAIAHALRPIAETGGTAAVVCTTVADAQTTYEYLRTAVFPQADDADGHSPVMLLHARFPADQREAMTQDIVARLGKHGPRPERLIVVATQVIEQSLDLDVDIMISDLAPISLLLQRSGRCWRHEKRWCGGTRPRPRPDWSVGPHLVVLVPVADGAQELTIPRHWGSVYHPYLLEATNNLLKRLDGGTISLPGDVQELVEEVHGEGTRFADEAQSIDSGASAEPVGGSGRARQAWDGEVLAQRSVADCVMIPTPPFVMDLSALHAMEIPDLEIGTRLGVDSMRVVCCYKQPDGRRTLDTHGDIDLPALASGQRHFTADQVRTVMAKTIPVNATKLKDRGTDTDVPSAWLENSWLAELVLLPHRRLDSRWCGPRIGSQVLTVDACLGLVIDA